MSLLSDRPTPPPEAYGAEPFSTAEIDAHPDAARIWATIMALRAEHEDACDEAYEQGVRNGND